MKVIYLASPYTNPSKDIEKLRYQFITELAGRLINKYNHALITPITSSHNIKEFNPDLVGTDFNFWKDTDLEFINRSDEVWVARMLGWEKSVGVTAEIKHALATGKPVYLVNLETLKLKSLSKTRIKQLA